MSKPSLLEELGLDENTLQWHQLALCGGRQGGLEGLPLSWFFEDYEEDPDLAVQVDEICLSCPVMKVCLSEARRNKDSGVRGAIYLTKGRYDKQRNAHKTEKVWKRIEERLK